MKTSTLNSIIISSGKAGEPSRVAGEWQRRFAAVTPRIAAAVAVVAVIIFSVIPLAAHASDSDAPGSDEFEFSPAVTRLISGYRGTVTAKLPDMPERRAIERPRSTVPGRMHMPRHLVIDKPHCRAVLVNALGDTLLRVPVCASRNRGQKRTKDDCRTPEGTFPLYGIYDSTDWTYEETTDKCYGPWFLSLRTPRYWGVGVHGTNAPGSVPGRRSHGCVRMHNANIITVKRLAQKDMRVTVMPDPDAD